MIQSLDELKAENAKAEQEQVTEALPEATDESEAQEVAAEEVSEETIEAGEPDSGSEETEVESWMVSEEQDSQDSEDAKFTGHDIAAAKTKLRAKLEKRHKSELEELKAELEALKQQKAAPVQEQGQGMPPRPKLEEFDYDEEAHQKALDAWDDKRLEAKLAAMTQMQSATQAQEAQKAKFSEAVDAHYQRAEKLAAENGISAELYQAADRKVREAFDAVFPGAGNETTESIIAKLGDGSEKVMYYLGRNTGKLSELVGTLRNDPSGISAAVMLGQLKSEVSAPVQRKSRAPAPAKRVEGDESSVSSSLVRKYREAVKSGNVQARIDLKREARRAGIELPDI